MKEIIVGILPQYRFKTDDNPYNDRYEFLELYSNRIFEANAIPMGLIPKNYVIPEKILEKCDAFLIQGGNKIEKYHYQIISYAIKNNKPLLGICLGFQALGIYSNVIDYLDGNLSEEKFFEIYNNLKKTYDGNLLQRIPSPNIHGEIVINYDNALDASHEITITDKDSIIYDVYKKDKFNVVSLHNYGLKNIGNSFKPTSLASYGIVESIEYKSKDHFILGVLWHPEWDNENTLFNRLVEEARNRLN